MSEQETAAQALERYRREYPARTIFEDRLRHFVREWAPENDRDRYEMQTQLSLLLREAMQSQTETFARGIDRYASQQMLTISLAPLNVIFEKPTKGA
jgi:hypothetical protein